MILSIEEAARMAAVSHMTVRRAIKDGKLHAVKIGKSRRCTYAIFMDELRTWIRARAARVPKRRSNKNAYDDAR